MEKSMTNQVTTSPESSPKALAQKPAGQTPAMMLFQLTTGHYISRAIYVAARLNVADFLAGGPRTHDELAQATQTHAPSLRRLLRLLASAGVLAEQEDGRFALTPVGEWLRSDIPGSRRAWALLINGPMVEKTWGELLYSVRTGEVAFEHAFGMNAFEYMSRHPEELKTFNEAMTGVTTQTAVAVAAAYDFSSLQTLADVGGGHGVLLITILKANPKLHGVLFEQPHVAEGAKKQIEAAGLSGRCEIVGGDFLQSVPRGADGYMLKHVIHDWNDRDSATILSNCRKAMAPGGKLLLIESVAPERMEPTWSSQIIAGSDINMLVSIGGRERTEAEYRALYDAAGFRLTRVIPTQALPSVLEGVGK
jgi:hypothetical protein